MKRKVALNTLGCKMNQYESDSLASDFIKGGYEIVPFDGEADVYIINTCTVTNKSDRKSRNTINKARKKEDSVVVVTGCYVDSARDKLEASTGITFIIENKRKNNIFSMVDGYFKGEVDHINRDRGDVFDFHTTNKGIRTRATIKIQDGCDSFCSYCIIPYVRGEGVSRPIEDIKESIKAHLKEGFKEIVLTGINMSRYDYKGMDFVSLVQELLKIEGDWRLRISSIEPDMMDFRIVDLFRDPKMMPHLHLCLQSGSEDILRDMKRTYSFREYMGIVDRLRAFNPKFNITTDLIVGFPGESDDLFNESLEGCKGVGFGHIHTFKYSMRKGTTAAERKDQVPENIKSDRSEVVRLLSIDLKRKYRESLIGENQRVLIEKVQGDIAYGFGEFYVPVKFCRPGSIQNEFIDVKITGIEDGEDPSLLAELI